MSLRPDGDVNVPKSVDDPNYRYHRPILRIHVEGRGGSTKTVIENLKEIARAFERPASYTSFESFLKLQSKKPFDYEFQILTLFHCEDVVKFLGIELGSQVIMNEKDNQYAVKGRHELEALESLLELFAHTFLLCYTCVSPETEIVISKLSGLQLTCMACGQVTVSEGTHRLCSFIEKNPPGPNRYAEAKKHAQARQSQAMPEWRAEAGSSSLQGPSAADDDDFINHWENTDFSADAILKRRQELLATPTIEAATSSSATPDSDPLSQLSSFLLKQPTPSAKESLQFVKRVALLHGFSDSKTLAAVFSALYEKDMMTHLKARVGILGLFVNTESEQKQLLFLLERLASTDDSVALKISTILNCFYESDLLDEEVIFKWYKHPSKKIGFELGSALRERSSKFVEWLRSAETEEESDE